MKFKHKYKRMIWVVAGLCLLLVIGSVITIVSIDGYQYHQNQKIIQSITETVTPSNTLVVFFSRSGNTELMARKIADIKKAHVFPITSSQYRIGVKGWVQALQDARNTEAQITPSKIDLAPYDTIYIGSPIWLYSPAPPAFQFARNNDFSGKVVVLFNTMNSKFEQYYIDEFKKLIEKNGGTFLQHIYIIRGRMTQQMDINTFLNEVEQKLKI
ncbi:flavodoxin [Limibacter armeniacum]|uniref:flavodoxin family protein n=1 Tax=Limibacter armeniacum TaxID=466084 RepID=UPI002FE526A5